jgi:hypothetical protein
MLASQINRETANYAVCESGGGKRRLYPSCQVKELFHPLLEERIDVKRHGAPSGIIASVAALDQRYSLASLTMPARTGSSSM